MNVFVTGATGFIGSAIVEKLFYDKRFVPIAAVRHTSRPFSSKVKSVQIGDLCLGGDWKPALQGIDVIVHAAARAHVMREEKLDPLAEFRKINVEGTLQLAHQALNSGVKRFVFISSIGVNGNETKHPFTEKDIPKPADIYAISKLEAEQSLQTLAASDMDFVIIRPPLVYGPGAPGNFKRLLDLVAKGIPLPLGAVCNKRSFVALENLVDLIITCISHPSASNQIFLSGDGADVSTTEFLQRIAAAFGKSAFLIPVPVNLLKIAALLIRKQNIVHRLCGTLQVDISKAQNMLGWIPPVSMDEELKKTADWYLMHQGQRSE